MKTVLEIACFNIESCKIAQEAGAQRIEFCNNYSNGGVTPSREEILKVRALIKIPLFVMVRPRGESFIFSNEEKEIMKADVLFCKENKIDGIVFGALTAENKIDAAFLKEIISLASPLLLTFHRAIDECENSNEAFQILIDLRVKRILTSGGTKSALSGKNKLKELQTKFGNKIIIMPGGGIRSENILEIVNDTGCNEFHSAAITDGSEIPDANEILKMKELLA